MEELEHYAQQRVGTVLKGKYTVDRVLGVGGMAVVYAATHRNRKQVAIKMLHAPLSMREDIRRRFLREGYVANSVKHPNAVDVIDDDVAEDGSAFLVMEMLEGRPVDAISQERGDKLQMQFALAIAHALCDVLAAAHAAGIVHRDIKPANLFVTRTGEVKVLDFGIARIRESSSTHDTGTGVMLGTPAFMAPEQASGNMAAIGPATDIWAVGATLFTLLTGTCVYEGTNAQQVVIATATTPPRSILAVLPSLPAELARIVDKALAFAPDQRWNGVESMKVAITECYERMFREHPGPHVLAPLVGGVAPMSGRPSFDPTAPATTSTATARSMNEPVDVPMSRMRLGWIPLVLGIVGLGTGALYLGRAKPPLAPPVVQAAVSGSAPATTLGIAPSTDAPAAASAAPVASIAASTAAKSAERHVELRPPTLRANVPGSPSVAAPPVKPPPSADVASKKPIDPGSIR